jgi:cytochrome c-type biogenesis protein CcmH/NrfG
MGKVYQDTGHFDEAALAFQSAARYAPEDPSIPQVLSEISSRHHEAR